MLQRHLHLEPRCAQIRRSPKHESLLVSVLGWAHFQGKCKYLQTSCGNECLAHSGEEERGLEKYYYKFLAWMTILVSSRGCTPSRTALSDFSGALTARLVCQLFFPAGLYSEGSFLLIAALPFLVTASQVNNGLGNLGPSCLHCVSAEKKTWTPDFPLLNNVTREEPFAPC